MKKIFFTTVCSLYVWIAVAQQKIQPFEIIKPKNKIESSLYSRIKVLDSRIDTLDMGFVQTGISNEKTRVYFETPLSVQINNLMGELIDSNAKEGELLFQLRKLNFSEITTMSEVGLCNLRAELYANKGDVYLKLASVDTLIRISAMDVTKSLLKKGGVTISDLISKNMKREPMSNETYTFADIQQIDYTERRRTPVYNVEKYTDGLYNTFNSFKKQQPDGQAIIEKSDPYKIVAKTILKNGKTKVTNCKEVFAIIYQGEIYIATDYGFSLMKKKNDDFYFTGRATVSADQNKVMVASLMFGLLGAAIASSDNSALFYIKLDHKNGRFIRLKELTEYDNDISDVDNKAVRLNGDSAVHPNFAKNEVFVMVEQMPEFQGGESEMTKFISQNIRYPIPALRQNVQGRVIIRFVIDKQGDVLEPIILKGIGSGCDEEAIRVIKKMPRWTPGKQAGKFVAVWYTLPIMFTISK